MPHFECHLSSSKHAPDVIFMLISSSQSDTTSNYFQSFKARPPFSHSQPTSCGKFSSRNHLHLVFTRDGFRHKKVLECDTRQCDSHKINPTNRVLSSANCKDNEPRKTQCRRFPNLTAPARIAIATQLFFINKILAKNIASR